MQHRRYTGDLVGIDIKAGFQIKAWKYLDGKIKFKAPKHGALLVQGSFVLGKKETNRCECVYPTRSYSVTLLKDEFL